MASVDTISSKHVLEDPEILPRKRFKTSELPLNATQKSTIDGLLHTIKKKGEYDSLRKKVWSQFEESVCLDVISKTSVNELSIFADPQCNRRRRQRLQTNSTSLPKQILIAIHHFCLVIAGKQLPSCLE